MPIPILYLNPHGDRAGAERVLDALIRGHLRREPMTFAPRLLCLADGRFSRALQDDGIPVDVHPLRLRRLARDVGWLRSFMKEHGIRLVHSTMAHLHQFAWLASRGTGVKTLWFNHGPCSPRFFKGLAHAFPADATVVEGRFIGRCHRGFTLAPPPRVIPYGVEPHWTEPRPDLRERTRSELGLADEQLAVGILGRIDAWKRQHCFLDAVARLPEEVARRARFFVGGEPALGRGADYFEELRRRREANHHRDRIRLLGYVESEPFLEGMDIMVHCAQDDPFPLVVIESLAKGKLVIGSDSGGVPEMITHGVDGFLQDPADAEGLASAITDAIRRFPDLARLGERATRTVLARFNTDRLVSDFEALYRELLGLPAAGLLQPVTA